MFTFSLSVQDIRWSSAFGTKRSCFECHLCLMHYPSSPSAIWSGLRVCAPVFFIFLSPPPVSHAPILLRAFVFQTCSESKAISERRQEQQTRQHRCFGVSLAVVIWCEPAEKACWMTWQMNIYQISLRMQQHGQPIFLCGARWWSLFFYWMMS